MSGSLAYSTCFFYRKKDELYFVTNYHVITDIEPILGKRTLTPVHDTAYLRLKDKKTGGWILCSLDLREIQKQFHWKRADYLPDVFISKIHLPEDAEVNSIEKFVNKSPLQLASGAEIFIFGYPDGVQYPEAGENYYNLYNQVKTYSATVNYTIAGVNWGPEQADTMDFEITTPTGFVGHGFSGSPTFSEVNGHFEFSGVYFSYTPQIPVAFVVKPEIFLKILDTTTREINAIEMDYLPSMD